MLLTDEGLDGVDVHVVNDGGAVEAEVALLLLRGGTVVAEGRQVVGLGPNAGVTLSGDALLGRFTDAARAYRFGPPGHDAVVARLRVDGAVVSEDVWFPGAVPAGAGLAVSAEADGEDVLLTLSAETVLVGVHIEARGWSPDDDHLTVTPGRPQVVRCRPTEGRRFKAWVSAVNAEGGVTVRV